MRVGFVEAILACAVIAALWGIWASNSHTATSMTETRSVPSGLCADGRFPEIVFGPDLEGGYEVSTRSCAATRHDDSVTFNQCHDGKLPQVRTVATPGDSRGPWALEFTCLPNRHPATKAEMAALEAQIVGGGIAI